MLELLVKEVRKCIVRITKMLHKRHIRVAQSDWRLARRVARDSSAWRTVRESRLVLKTAWVSEKSRNVILCILHFGVNL